MTPQTGLAWNSSLSRTASWDIAWKADYVRHGIHIPNFGPFGSARVIAGLAAEAERSGWDGVFVWDHVVRREGDFPVVDPWVALAAAAVATTRVLLGPLVTPLPRRRPWNGKCRCPVRHRRSTTAAAPLATWRQTARAGYPAP